MTISYTNFFAPTILGTSVATLYTMPTSPTSSLLRGGRIRLANTTGAAVSATLYAVPVAGVSGSGNAFASGISVPANNVLDLDVPILPAGATLQALAGAATSITAHMISGGIYS